jgi:hypothetical protein
MKHYKHTFPKYFYSYMDETKRTRLINLSRKENRYCYEYYCNIFFFQKTKDRWKKMMERYKKRSLPKVANFFDQHLKKK